MTEVTPAHRVLADAIASLFAPLVEVAIHDLASDTMVYVANPMSPRGVGDPSNLRELSLAGPSGFIGPYEKTNWDGHRLKSVSVLLPGDPATMMCINADLSAFETLRSILDTMLRAPAAHAIGEAGPLLRQDWHETLNRHVASWCAERGLDARKLDREQRSSLVRSILEAKGFEAPRAVAYVSNLLGLSRATIYNAIAMVRKEALAA